MLWTLLLIVCYLVVITGNIMCIVAAFRQGVLWGLAYLFIPIAALIFIVKYWQEAKAGFLLSLTGLILMFGIAGASPSFRDNFMRGYRHGSHAADPHAEAVKALSARIDADRAKIADLQAELTKVTNDATARYQQLADKRKTLKADDQASVHQFNLEAADYQKLVARMKDIKQQITTLNTELDSLLSQRDDEQRAIAESKKVVIYSTSWCPTCKVAKSYMDSNGIAYREVDVEKSPEGAEEYRAHGGSGSVPLIVVGDQKMVGFSSQQLKEMLADN